MQLPKLHIPRVCVQACECARMTQYVRVHAHLFAPSLYSSCIDKKQFSLITQGDDNKRQTITPANKMFNGHQLVHAIKTEKYTMEAKLKL